MSRFVNVMATDEVVLANGDKVQVRQSLMAAEEAALTRNLMRLKFDVKEGQPVVEEGDWHLQRLRICEAYVVGWNFKEDDGGEVPCTLSTIGRLDADTVNEIAEAVDALQKKRKEQAEKNAKRR